MAETKDLKVIKEPVKVEKKPDVVVNFNVTEALAKATEEFNVLAKQLKEQDEKIKKANAALGAEKNKLYTRAVEIQGTIRYLQSQLEAQNKPKDKTQDKK